MSSYARWLGLSLSMVGCLALTRSVAAQEPAGGRAPAASAPGNDPLLARIDHLIYATPALQRGIEEIEQTLGVRATMGGQLGGTLNALVSLGPSMFLEILAPDHSQPAQGGPRPFRLDELKASKLVTWAVSETDLEPVKSESAAKGMPLGEIRTGERKQTNGELLSWRFTTSGRARIDGISIFPFFIQWTTPNPARTSAKGATLVGLRAEHPDPAGQQRLIQRFGLNLIVRAGPAPALIAIIDCPRGRVELR